VRFSDRLMFLLLFLPVGASADVGFDNFFFAYESAEAAGSGGDISGDTLVIRREFSPFSAFALSGEYSNTRFERDIDQQTAILQGLVYVPGDTFTLVFGAGWLATEIDAGSLDADEDGPVVSLEGRFRFSEKLGMLLGVDHVELDEASKTNIYRASLLLSDGETPLDIVFNYEISDTEGSSDTLESYGIGLRCNF